MSKIKDLKKINVADVEEKLGYEFSDKSILRQAFVRSSFAYECEIKFDNEELEFIGDSVLGMLVARLLSKRLLRVADGVDYGRIRGQWWRDFEMDEAEMSKMKIKLVQRKTLASAIDKLDLAKYLCLGSGDEQAKVYEQDSVKEDLFEAILGAVALDCDWHTPTLESVLIKMMDPITLIEQGLPDEPSYEELLGKWYLEKYGKPLEITLSEEGEDGSVDAHIDLGKKMRHKHINAEALTPSGAKRLAAKRAWEFVVSVESLAERVLEVIGTPSRTDPMVQINMLEQKKIIPKVAFSFCEVPADEGGNPTWQCQINIDELDIHTNDVFTFPKKSEAKNFAASALLHILIKKEFCPITSEDYPGIAIMLPASRDAFLEMENKMSDKEKKEILKIEYEELDPIESLED
ncbi:MAG: hypothetical protein IJE25_04205 [Clostridia bacterium]|nr:hypothetical protein [Clostridia bacterium]